jgi:UDP-N-acetylglucosamine acyltransferase
VTDVHRTAVVADGAGIDEGVDIGPYCVIGPHVKIGAGTRLMSHVVIDGWTTLGRDCRVFPFATLGAETQDMKFSGEQTFVEIGDGTTIRECVTVNASTNEGETTRVGSGCLIMAYCHVAHACDVGDRVIMANSAHLAGHVTIEEKAIIGGVTAVHQFVRIGTLCMVGAGSKLVQDCPPYMMIDGNPARVRGINGVGLKRNGVDGKVRNLLKQSYRALYRDGLSTRQAVEKIRSGPESAPEVDRLLAFVEGSERGIVK